MIYRVRQVNLRRHANSSIDRDRARRPVSQTGSSKKLSLHPVSLPRAARVAHLASQVQRDGAEADADVVTREVLDVAQREPSGARRRHKAFVLGSKVLHADETPVPMLDPGAGKTKKAYILSLIHI